jgi:hypothetical protein
VRFLDSPRRRRRLITAAIVVGIAGPLIYLGVHFSTPGSQENANGPYINNDNFYRQPKHVRFTAARRRAVDKVLARFIGTAVARNHVDDSWTLASADFRRGFTRRQWASGNIPVVPFPAAKHTTGLIQYSYRNKVGLEVLLFPKRGSGYSIATVDADIVRTRDGHWRVDNWMVTKFHGPGATGPSDSASALGEGPPNVHKLPGKQKASKANAAGRPRPRAADDQTGSARLGKTWLLLPAGLLLLALVALLMVGTVVLIRNRRAAAAYKRPLTPRDPRGARPSGR